MQNLTTDNHNIEMTQAIMHALDDWKLDGKHILSVLALPNNIKVRHLSLYRNLSIFPNTPEVNERVQHLAGILNALATSYPTNPRMSLFWMIRKSKKFQNRSPLQVIIDDDLKGLISIRKHLDCSYDWFGDESSLEIPIKKEK